VTAAQRTSLWVLGDSVQHIRSKKHVTPFDEPVGDPAAGTKHQPVIRQAPFLKVNRHYRPQTIAPGPLLDALHLLLTDGTEFPNSPSSEVPKRLAFHGLPSEECV
jgi:hypothetical protein